MMFMRTGRGNGHRRIAIQGQSNSMGKAFRADLNASPLNTSDPGLVQLDANVFPRVFIWSANSGTYEQLRMGVNNDAVDSTTFGPEFGLAVRWMRETAHGNLYIDKQYGDGQPISYFQQGTSFFSTNVSRKQAQNAWLVANGIRAVDMGWLWVQGESDSNNSQSYYQGALDAYVSARISTGMMGSSDMRVIARMIAGTVLWSQAIDNAKLAYAAANPTTVKLFQMSNHFNSDNLHCNAQGQLQMGYDAFSYFFSKTFKTA